MSAPRLPSFILHKNGEVSLFPGQVKITLGVDGRVAYIHEKAIDRPDGPYHLQQWVWKQVWSRISNRGHRMTKRSRAWLPLRQCLVRDPAQFVNSKHVILRRV